MKILIVEDDPLMQATLKTVFKEAEVSLAATFDEAVRCLNSSSYGAAFLDINLKGGSDGVELLKKIRERDTYLPCVMISGVTDRGIIARCLDHGAVDYVIKAEGNPDLYRLALHKAMMWKKLFSESRMVKRPNGRGNDASDYEMLGTSVEILKLRETIEKAGQLEGPFLILGETGTGKELAARRIWAARNRLNNPFIALNCASLPENLVESELFGYERGAFTGALQAKTGLFEAANGGDIFLDEIGELSRDLQAKLLRVLQEKKVRRLGSDKERPLDFRVIAATNLDMARAVEEGEFRDDLYYRLNVHQIRVPSLRERKQDILPLLQAFLSQRELGNVTFDESASTILTEFRWPGNVRQLQAFSQYIVPYLDSDRRVGEELVRNWIECNQVGTKIKKGEHLEPEEEVRRALNDKRSVDIVGKLDGIQRAYVESALRISENNRSRAARLLGVSRQRLSNWLNEWGLD